MRKALVSGLLILTMIGASVSGAGPAAADPIEGGTASSFGALATLMDGTLVGPVASATVTAPPFSDDVDEALLDVSPLAPLTFGGAATAEARVHEASDIDTILETEVQPLAGPYNAQAVGQTDDVEVLFDVLGEGIPVAEADLIRSEAVATCVGDEVVYSAQSETQNLDVLDRSELGDAIDAILLVLFPGLDPLDPLLNIEENVITELDDGIAVDALVLTLAQAIDPAGLVQLRIGHAEVSGVTCADDGTIPECSDGIDNDGDGDIDFPDDLDCESPEDPTERPECSDGIDNDGDGEVDIDDPGCHTDGDPDNPDSFDPGDDDETDGGCINTIDDDGDGDTDIDDPDCHTDGDPNNPDSFDPDRTENSGPRGALPKTGTAVPTAAAAGLGLAAMAMLALRRRSITV